MTQPEFLRRHVHGPLVPAEPEPGIRWGWRLAAAAFSLGCWIALFAVLFG